MKAWVRYVTVLMFLYCSTLAHAGTVLVAAAPNIKFAFDNLEAAFQQQTGIAVKTVYASSGALTQQIEAGAPYDVFLAADTKYPERLYTAGMTASAPKVYAYGTLVLWSKAPVDLTHWQALLKGPEIRKIAVPNPRLAPYGLEALRALKYYHLFDPLKGKIIYGENLLTVIQYVDVGAAEVGFTAKSLMVAPEMRGRGYWVEIPQSAYKPIAQSAVLLKRGASNTDAQKFLAFVYSPAGRRILKANGYRLP